MTKNYILRLLAVIVATSVTVPTILYIFSFVHRKDILVVFLLTIIIAQVYMKVLDPSDVKKRREDSPLHVAVKAMEVEIEAIKDILHREGFIDRAEVSLKASIVTDIRNKEEESKSD